jgi:hypothetical protein
MNSMRYLNGILTVVAVLLALNLATWWLGGAPGWVNQAQAEVASKSPSPLDAGAMQKQTVDLLKVIAQKADDQMELFRSGKARVTIENGSNK